MVALEQEIMEKVRELDDAQKQQLLKQIDAMRQKPPFNFNQWMAEVEQFHAQLTTSKGDNFRIDVQSLLDEVREEPNDDRLGGR